MDNYSLLLIIFVVVMVLGGFMVMKNKSFSPQPETSGKNREIIVPLRLQAYERICLYLERITPENLILRIAGQCNTAIELQQLALHEIREEFNHNLAQQIYISPATWEAVKNARDEVITLINQSAGAGEPTDKAIVLGKRIMETHAEANPSITAPVILSLKTEIQSLF